MKRDGRSAEATERNVCFMIEACSKSLGQTFLYMFWDVQERFSVDMLITCLGAQASSEIDLSSKDLRLSRAIYHVKFTKKN